MGVKITYANGELDGHVRVFFLVRKAMLEFGLGNYYVK